MAKLQVNASSDDEDNIENESTGTQRDPAIEKVAQALSTQIRTFRTAAGIASGTLAKRAGISHSMLSRIEKGTATPSIETLTRIAMALGKPVSRFFVDQSERHDCSFVPAGQGVTVDREGSSYGHVYRLIGHVPSLGQRTRPQAFSFSMSWKVRCSIVMPIRPIRLGPATAFFSIPMRHTVQK
jgi:transcriptional regulator with XRE-family HTH domain